MKLLEYEAKEILRRAGLPVPQAVVLRPGDALPTVEFPAVVKSQVPIGGRGKAGGVAVVQNEAELAQHIDRIFALEIKGFTPHSLMIEQALEIDRELYLSIVIDTEAAEIVLMAHENGGVDVEDNNQSDFMRISLSDPHYDSVALQLSEYFDLPDQAFLLAEMVQTLKQVFVNNDATLLEINPLIYTKSKQLQVGDCKMELDDAALFRHPDWEFEADKVETNFVTLNQDGIVATVANGAGLAMSTVDAVAAVGLKPANFLDIGGGANEASVLAAFKRIVEYKNVDAIVINIFAGITRCDEVAKAIISAKNNLPNLPQLYIRLEGTNFEIAETLLQAESIRLFSSLETALVAVKKELS